MNRFTSDQHSTTRRRRLVLYQAIIAAVFVLLGVRIFQLQFVINDSFEQQADENRFDQVSIAATRGIILDRNGAILANNVASANVRVTPALLPEDEAEELAVLERLAGLLGIAFRGQLTTVDERGIPQRSLLTMVQEGEGIAPFRPVTVQSDVDHDIARLLISEARDFPGVDVEWVSVREYPTGGLTSHIIGYMGPIPGSLADEFEAQGYVLDRDRIGYDGVEFFFQDVLAGQPGLQRVERDVAGEVVRLLGEPRLAQNGYSLQLTLDLELQAAAQRVLLAKIEELKRENPDNAIGYDRGVVIAADPRTGEILAMVSLPTYDNGRFARNIDYPYYLQLSQDPLRPLFNQAVNSLYPPGSVFKVITLTGALEERVVTADFEVQAPGPIILENRYYPNDPGRSQEFVCWINKNGGFHGLVPASKSLAWSCDIYYYKIGGGYQDEIPEGLGITRLGNWMQLFGLGSPTGIELAGENAGFVPDPVWKRRVWNEGWSTGDTYNSAFGQGYTLVTPLQMLNVQNIIANNGIATQPTLIREITDDNGQVIVPFQPNFTDMREVLREWWPTAHTFINSNGQEIPEPYPETLDSTLATVQLGLREAVTFENGTALPAQEEWLPYVPIAGKTGTAEFCDNIAAALEQCEPGNWPAHAWFMAYAPYNNPEISVIAFVYNGAEGSAVALPIVGEVMDIYFQLKAERAMQAASSQTTQ